MRLLLIEGLSRNDVMSSMTRELGTAFAEIGVQARCAPANPADLDHVLAAEFARGDFDGVLSFASFGAEAQTPEGLSIYADLPYGFTGWNVDHPSYQYTRTTTHLVRRHTICASDHHFRFIELMGGRGRKLPMLPGATIHGASRPWSQRSTSILVAMSWMGRPERWWANAAGTPVHALMEAMLERLMADPDLDVGAAYRGATQALRLRAPLNADLTNLVARLLTYVRQHDRLELIEGLRAAGLHFTLCGDSWDGAIKCDSRITHRPPVDMGGLNALYGQSKVIVNLNAANGASERAISAMGAGAAVVTDPGALLAETFGKSIAVYDRTNVKGTIGVIGELLEGGRGETMASASYDKVTSSHRWIHKAQTIVDALRTAWP